ncbi:hypothetical protein MKW98_029641 [Papaver atlanticum]|uniref:Protein kinase domain-containing protein n=1 Tax=Papaver atlanticum TaxID=357466 RepID=A0AAD4XRF5_9MAGN|nr:hypothetical protein MKW98_029641 [Papaver atlanticum]
MRRFKLKVSTFHVILLIFMEFCFRSTFCQSEKEILLQFKGNISNDPYNSLNSWGLDRDQCGEYNGVLCNSEGNVEKIVLWNMSLEGVLSPSLSKLKSLRILSLYGNRFTGNIPLEFGEFQNLWKLNLSSNGLVGRIPEFLGTYKNLRLLDLSRNGFTDEIPDNLFTNCFKMKFISLSNNNLTGSIPASMSNCLSLIGFDFSFNDLSGFFPEEICGGILGLVYVSLRRNSLAGNVQEQVLRCRNLQVLDLGSNAFDGLVPFDVVSFQNLSYFNASFNQFIGEIPDVGMCSDRMEVFDVSGNRLVGEIPVSLTNCRNMRVLDLGLNKLDGRIPVEIGNLKKLSVLRLGDNVIQGTIPNEISSIEFLQVLDLHNLKLSGGISGDLSKCRFLLELDLSSNNLQGEIPQTLNNMTYLTILDLHRNRLNGTIPMSLGELLRLQYLDLSENSLAGPIPPSLGNLTLLTHFNLSSNDLSGSIPLSPIIQKFGSTAYSKNPSLCGVPLDTPCSETGNGGTTTSRKTRVLSISAIVAIVAAVVILCGVCIICVMNIRARKRKKDESLALESTPPASTDSNLIIGKLVLFSKSLPSKYEDWEAGTKALLDKDCLIGGGAIGTVYKTNFEGGISIAVKKLETLGRIRNQDEFEQEIGRLGNLHHPNLVAFQGYYWSSTMQLILSEFASNGNLYQHLHGYIHPGASTSTSTSRGQLNWSRRFQIAVGTARALAYLHHDCKPQVLHLNIKSTNILLDERYEPKLSDYGLLKLLPLLDSYGLAKFHTAVGYVAPELACQSLTFSDKCDVYSFGIILLELVTGKKPVESPAASEVVVLCDYVRGLLEEGSASLCFDRSLQGFVESELIQVMKLGLICTSEMPSRRPSMAEVVQVLETIRSG